MGCHGAYRGTWTLQEQQETREVDILSGDVGTSLRRGLLPSQGCRSPSRPTCWPCSPMGGVIEPHWQWPIQVAKGGGTAPTNCPSEQLPFAHPSRLRTMLPRGPSLHTGPLELIHPSSEMSKCVLLVPSRGPQGRLWLPLGTQPSPGLWAHH